MRGRLEQLLQPWRVGDAQCLGLAVYLGDRYLSLSCRVGGFYGCNELSGVRIEEVIVDSEQVAGIGGEREPWLELRAEVRLREWVGKGRPGPLTRERQGHRAGLRGERQLAVVAVLVRRPEPDGSHGRP